MSIKFAAAIALLGTVFLSAHAFAGQKFNPDVSVTSGATSGNASGVLSAARNSPDGRQRIGCQVSTSDGSTTLSARCEAANAQGVYVACGTTAPHLVQQAMSVKSDSFVSFFFVNTTPGALPRCTAITVDNNSLYAPKLP